MIGFLCIIASSVLLDDAMSEQPLVKLTTLSIAEGL